MCRLRNKLLLRKLCLMRLAKTSKVRPRRACWRRFCDSSDENKNSMMQYLLKGKNVLVTGASLGKSIITRHNITHLGLGKTLVKALVSEQANVYAVARSVDNLKKLKEEVPGIQTISCDLSDWKATETALHTLDAMDHLVNNAGVADRISLSESSEESFDKHFNINVKGVINVTKIITNKMIAAGKNGSIVNISSISAAKPTIGCMFYCATKASVDMLTKCMAMELAPNKIRVMSVNPTLIPTEMGEGLWPGKIEEVTQGHPLKELPTPEAVTNAVLFLLSDLAKYSTGTCLYVDSGMKAQW